MIPLTNEENEFYEKQKVIYAKKNFDKVIKIHLNYTMNLTIIVITLENLEKQLIIFAI